MKDVKNSKSNFFFLRNKHIQTHEREKYVLTQMHIITLLKIKLNIINNIIKV